MARYVVKRFLLMIPTLIGVAVLIFLLLRVIPGDVVEVRFVAQGQFTSQDVLQIERAKLGLDQPLWKQFVTWMWGLLRFDFGVSMWTGAPITEEIKLRFALSLQLSLMATVVATVLAIPLGIVAALKQDTWVDYGVRVFSIAGLAMPSFWLGILMILAFLIVFEWLPPMIYTPFWVDPWQNLAQLIWPALAVCGYAPRMRLDLTVNILSIHALVRKLITVHGGGQLRPNINIRDMIEAYRILLEAPADKVAGQTFNAGYENHSVADIAEMVRAEVRDPAVQIKVEPTVDNRSYHINSDRIANLLGFRARHTIRDAVRSICDAYAGGLMPDPMGDRRYYNIKTMQAVGLR